MNNMFLYQRQGFILIFAIWVLGFLTILAVGIAAGIRQKIVVLEKLDQRDRLIHLLEGAVQYSAVYVSDQLNKSAGFYNVNVKMNLHNNGNDFGQFNLAEDNASINYTLVDQGEYFGVIDEERKINLNTTNESILTRLIERVLNLRPEVAATVARDLLDWRQFGESQAKGFFSDEYYSNLNYPYPKKDSNYETLDELLLVKGMNEEIYGKLINYVTIYGDGKININTASAEVLYALGLDDLVVEKILEVRQGKDKLDATEDDHIFLKTFDVATEINTAIKLLPAEARSIDALNQKSLLTTVSYYFTVSARAQLAHSSFVKSVRAIISSRENRIVYWQER